MDNIFLISSKLPPEYSGSGNRVFKTALKLEEKFNYRYKMICSSTVKRNFQNFYFYNNREIYLISKKFFDQNIKRSKIQEFINFRLNYFIEFFFLFKFLFSKRKSINFLHIVGNVNITNASIIFAKIFKIPIILEIVNDIDTFNFYIPKLFKIIFGEKLNKNDKIIVISKKLEKMFLNFGYNQSQIWHKPNPVDKKFFEISPKIRSEEVIILHLAKFIPRKKQDFMIEVLNNLPSNYKLILAGPFENSGLLFKRDLNFLNSVKKKIKDLNLENRVEVIDKFIGEPKKYFEKCDIFVLPSTNEGLGTTVLEAVASQRPVVCNNVKDVYGVYVENNKNGFLVDLDIKEWVKKILLCKNLTHENLKIAREKVREIASEEIIISQYNELIKKVIRK